MKSILVLVAFWFVVSGDLTYASPPLAPSLLRVRQAPCAFNLPGAALEWLPVTDAVKYRVYWAGVQQREVPHQLGSLAAQYLHRWNVPVGDESDYSVTAVNASHEESAPSNVVTLTTIACGPLPTQPLDFSVVATGCDSTLLVWTPGAAGERRIWIGSILRVFPSKIRAYRIRRATDADVSFITGTSVRTFLDWHLGDVGLEPDNFYFDDGLLTPRYGEPLAGGGTYYYTVQAVNAEGNRSPYSNVVEVTMPLCP